MADSMTQDSMTAVEDVVRMYESAVNSSTDARKNCERDRDYYDNKQWTSDEIATLEKRKQPVITRNRIKPKIDFLLGAERQSRTDPKGYPRTPDDEQAAHAATDAIRYVCDRETFDVKRSEVAEDIFIEGTGGAIVEIDQKGRICIRRIPWDRLFWDPHSRCRDFSDAKYRGIVAWMDIDEAISLYGEGVREVLEVALASSTEELSDTYDDKPRVIWVDSKRKRVRLVEMYYRHRGVWYCCVFTKSGFVVEAKPCEYLDEDEEPVCPLEIQSAHVDRDGNRYGLARQLIGIQDEVNKRASKSVHLINVRQWVIERGATDDINRFRQEAAKPDGVLEVNKGFLATLQRTDDMANGNIAMLQEAKGEIDAIGANAAMQGKDDRSMSGRALQQRSQGGMVEVGPAFDSLRQWQRRIYRQIWYRIKQYWTEETWVRVTDDENNLKFVGLNQPITLAEKTLEEAEKQGRDDIEALKQALAKDPQAQVVVGTRNDVSRLDLDIIIEDAPDTVTLQGEQFQMLAEMLQSNPQNGIITMEDLVEASSLRNKEAMLERAKQRQAQMAPERQKAQMLELMERVAALEEKRAEVRKTTAETENEQADTELTRAQAINELAEAGQRWSGPPEPITEPAGSDAGFFVPAAGVPGDVTGRR